MSKNISVLVRLTITLLIFWLVFSNVEISDVMAGILQADILLVIMALLFQLLSILLASYRWKTVMHRLGFGGQFVFYLRSYFKGSFFNQGLPTSIGGDALRVLDVARTGHRKRDSFYGVAVDRGLGLAGLLVLNLAAMLLSPDLLPQQVYWLINAVALAGLFGFLGLYFFQRLRFVDSWIPIRVLMRISNRLSIVLSSWSDVGFQLVLSLLIHLLAILAIYSLANAVGLTFSLLTYMVIVPPVILLTLIPISLAGWGVREGGMVGLFALVGGDQTLVLSMSILYGMTLIISSLPGLYAYLSGKHAL